MRRLLKKISEYLDDLLLVAGCACVLRGLSLLSAVATWIAAGIMLIGFGVMIGRVRAQKHAAAKLAE